MKKILLSLLLLFIPLVTFAQEKGLDQQIGVQCYYITAKY